MNVKRARYRYATLPTILNVLTTEWSETKRWCLAVTYEHIIIVYKC